MQPVRVASVQFEHVPHDKAANLSIIEGFVTQAAQQGVDIICFPECCISGYWTLRKLSADQLRELAEPIPSGPATQRMLAWSKQHDMTIGAGLVELADDGTMYNSFVVTMPDGRWVVHRKIHCFISGHMASGDRYTVFDTPHGVRVGVLICYDNNIIENVRATALGGAEVLLAPHQTGGCDLKNPHAMGPVDRALWDNRQADPAAIEAELKGDKGRGWLMRWLPSRAHDNGMFVVFSNGVGVDDDEVRTGNAMVIDPYGRILAETWKADNDMVVADLDASLLSDQTTGRRWMQTRRPELYTPLTQRTGAEVDTRASRMSSKPA